LAERSAVVEPATLAPATGPVAGLSCAICMCLPPVLPAALRSGTTIYSAEPLIANYF
jgi:hypothetical protein